MNQNIIGSREYRRLKGAHAAIQQAITLSPTGATDRQMQREQDAYDALIEYVDATPGYTWSNLDPRGTYAEYCAERHIPTDT